MVDLRDVLATRFTDTVDIEGLDDGDVITDAIVLLRVQRLDSTDDALIIGASDAMGGITQYGIISAAKLQVEKWMTQPGEED